MTEESINPTPEDEESSDNQEPEQDAPQESQASEEQGQRIVRKGVEYNYTEEHGHREV